jgi:hypothetical protein
VVVDQHQVGLRVGYLHGQRVEGIVGVGRAGVVAGQGPPGRLGFISDNAVILVEKSTCPLHRKSSNEYSTINTPVGLNRGHLHVSSNLVWRSATNILRNFMLCCH